MPPNTNELRCPSCEAALLEHPATECLARWFFELLGWTYHCAHYWRDERGNAWFPDIVHNMNAALRVLEWIWEHDEAASLYKNYIEVGTAPDGGGATFIEGSVPLRICRAAIWLASHCILSRTRAAPPH